MVHYRYSGFDGAGHSVAGTIEAPAEKAALDLLADGGIIPSEIELDPNRRAPVASDAPGQRRTGRRGRIPMTARVLFVRELATFLQADIPLLEALGVIHEQETNAHLRAILGDIHHRVQGGESFSSALGRYPKVFSPLLVSMARVGETGGMLGGVMDQMANWMEHEEEVRGEIRGALAYPAIIVALGILTVIILTTAVLPRIAGIFTDSGTGLPLLTRALMAFSGFMGQWWWLVLLGAASLGGLGFWWLRRPAGRSFWDRFSLRLPLVGSLARHASIARFARASAALLANGVPLLEALRVVRGLLGNQVMTATIDDTIERVTRGQSLARSLAASPWFPPAVIHLLAVGERTGRLGDMFERIARTFERQTRGRIKVLLDILSPLLIVFLAVMVGIIALAILLPIMQMNQLMR